MTKTRSAWEDVRISLVFPRAHWKRVTVIRVERRTTKRARGEGRFEERYTLQCDCGKKFRLDSKVFNRASVRDCGIWCLMRNPGPTPESLLRGYMDMVTGTRWGGVYEGKDPHTTCMRIVRAAKAHGWKV